MYYSFNHVHKEDATIMKAHISVLDRTLAFIPVLKDKVRVVVRKTERNFVALCIELLDFMKKANFLAQIQNTSSTGA